MLNESVDAYNIYLVPSGDYLSERNVSHFITEEESVLPCVLIKCWNNALVLSSDSQ